MATQITRCIGSAKEININIQNKLTGAIRVRRMFAETITCMG